MALKTDIRGMVWKYPDAFVVGREQVRQYARAVKALDPATHDEAAAAELGHDALIAPLTFASIFAVMIQRHFFQHVDVGMETMQIVQVDQKFMFHRPIKVGDDLTGTMYVEVGRRAVRRRHRHHPQRVHRRQRRGRDGGLHHADGPRGRQLDLGEVGSRKPGRSCARQSVSTVEQAD